MRGFTTDLDDWWRFGVYSGAVFFECHLGSYRTVELFGRDLEGRYKFS